MTRALYVWELGAGLGHAAPLIRLARSMVAARPGIEPVFCFREPAVGRQALDGEDWPILPAPAHSGTPAALTRAASYVELLSRLGFGDREQVRASLACWDDIYRVVSPDLIVADHAPSAIAAARGRLPVMAIGTGFTLPPAQTPEFPSLRRDLAPPTLHRRILKTMNETFQLRGQPELRHLPELLATEGRAFLGLPQLDPYFPLRADRPMGLPEARPPLEPVPANGPVFFYSRAEEPKLDEIAEGLATAEVPVEAFVLGANTPAAELLRNAGAVLHESPPPLAQVLPRARIVLSHGGAGLTGAALVAGRAQVILPIHVESEINGLRVTNLGTGIAVANVTSASVAEALTSVYQTRMFHDAAAEVAGQIARDYYPPAPLAEIAEAALNLLR